MRFNQTFFVLFPQFELQFSVIENLLQGHYKRKLVGLEYPTVDEFQADVEKMKDQIDPVAKLVESGGEVEVDFKSLDKYIKAQMKFLSNSYLVKSASLLEGLIWGINEKNSFVATICLRQEIEILGMAHYANCLFEFDQKDKRNRNDELMNLLLGSRIPNDSKYKAIRVSTGIKTLEQSFQETYDALSEFVHPNGMSNLAHVKDNEHFWKGDFVANPDFLVRMLNETMEVFSATLTELDNLPPMDREIGYTFFKKE